MASSTPMGAPGHEGEGPGRFVAPAVAGDRAALHDLLSALAPSVLATTRRILRERADAEEAAQECLIALVRDLPSLREPRAVIAFATRAASRVAVRARRRRDLELSRRAELEPTHASAPSPAAVLSSQERAERLLRVLDRLPEEQAETLVLRYVVGYEPAEIAAAMQTPVNTVRSRVRLARLALARELEGDPELCPAEGGAR